MRTVLKTYILLYCIYLWGPVNNTVINCHRYSSAHSSPPTTKLPQTSCEAWWVERECGSLALHRRKTGRKLVWLLWLPGRRSMARSGSAILVVKELPVTSHEAGLSQVSVMWKSCKYPTKGFNVTNCLNNSTRQQCKHRKQISSRLITQYQQLE